MLQKTLRFFAAAVLATVLLGAWNAEATDWPPAETSPDVVIAPDGDDLWNPDAPIQKKPLSIITHIEIDAPADRVWSILTNLSAYPLWNPFIRSIAGRLAPGDSLSVTIAPPGRGQLTFEPRVLAVRPGQEIRWLGSFLTAGLFDGEHVLMVKRLSSGRTLFTQGERFSGHLRPILMDENAADSTKRGFIAMNKALKLRAEGKD